MRVRAHTDILFPRILLGYTAQIAANKDAGFRALDTFKIFNYLRIRK